MKFPKTLKIGHRTFSLDIVKGLESSDGQSLRGFVDFSRSSISIVDYMTFEETLEVILHEVLHAIYCQYALNDKDKEERIVSTLAVGITEFILDNPKFIGVKV